jgi:hypothetical protein
MRLLHPYVSAQQTPVLFQRPKRSDAVTAWMTITGPVAKYRHSEPQMRATQLV